MPVAGATQTAGSRGDGGTRALRGTMHSLLRPRRDAMQATWYFDFISPFAYLQLPRILALRSRIDITPTPIVFGAVLAHHGQLGPAEIAGKREFTYRFVQWQADTRDIGLRFPPAHPFNPLAALRLCIAAGSSWDVVVAIFDHIWRDGNSGASAAELADIGNVLGVTDISAAIACETVKARLRANTGQAIAANVFGVPTLQIGDESFWGNDASAMIEAYLDDPDVFASAEYRRIAQLPLGVERSR
jgi:2-hydroxychromene-2-carboxylate isomerase